MRVDDLLELMAKGTVRSFRPDEVPDDRLQKVLEAARWAPSGANTQPWELVVIRAPELKQEIARIFVAAHRRARAVDPSFPYEGEERLLARFTTSPVLIAVCADSRFERAYPRVGYRERILYVSVAAAIQNMMLAARACGLALSWGTVDRFCEGALGRLLGLPEHLRVLEVLQLGYPAEEARPRFRRPASDFTHLERFDPRKLRGHEEIERLLRTRREPDIYSSPSGGQSP